MCGIFGMIGRINGNAKRDAAFQLLTRLAVETQVRGSHATGYATLRVDHDRIEFAKEPVPATEFVSTIAWAELAEPRLPDFVIGHCRWATHGSPKVPANNHPFFSHDGRLALVHNGMISGHRRIAHAEKVGLTSECDSEILMRITEKCKTPMGGIKRVFRAALGGGFRGGDAAVAMIDRDDKTMYLYRNTGRPCHVARIPVLDNVVVFASTETILRNAIEGTLGKGTMAKGFETNSYRVYKIQLDGECGPDIITEDIETRVYTTGDYFRSSRPAPTRQAVTTVGTQANLFDHGMQGWDCDMPLDDTFRAEYVECDCGHAERLWPGEARVCRVCGVFELSPEHGATPVNDEIGIEWLKHHCNACGSVWSQKFLAMKCIKCGDTWIEVTNRKPVHAKKARKRNRVSARPGGNGHKPKPGIWVCVCGLSMIAMDRPKQCGSCGRKRGKHFRFDGALTESNMAELKRLRENPGVKADRGTLPKHTNAKKTCHDCNAVILYYGPSRCDACREKRNARRRDARRAKGCK